MAKNKDTAVQDHLEWLVRCRSQNQHTSLKLYNLMTANKATLNKDRKLAGVGISLVAVLFNLWRAVFLADSARTESEQVDHAISFLKTLISDNAIAYTQDKNARAWTFSSYLNNARYRLEGIAKVYPPALPNFTPPSIKASKSLWESLQNTTDLAVANYANALSSAAN